MPYSNIVFVKIFWKKLLFEDKKGRFVEQLNDDQKGLFLMLFLLAGATNNNIKNDENFLKRILNLREKTEKIRENLDKILEVFSDTFRQGEYLNFKKFKKLHNWKRKDKGTPKEIQSIIPDKDKEKEIRKRIEKEYITLKGWDKEDLDSSDYARMNRRINELILKAKGNDTQIVSALNWVANQNYADWTLETILKKWPDFMKRQVNIQAQAKQGEESKAKIEKWKKESKEKPIDPKALSNLTKGIGEIK